MVMGAGKAGGAWGEEVEWNSQEIKARTRPLGWGMLGGGQSNHLTPLVQGGGDGEVCGYSMGVRAIN